MWFFNKRKEQPEESTKGKYDDKGFDLDPIDLDEIMHSTICGKDSSIKLIINKMNFMMQEIKELKSK